MKILHVITGLGKAAGTSTFCGEVCNQLAARGHDVTIAVCNPAASDIYPLDKRVKLVSIESVLHSSTLHADYDIIHIHGLWSFCLHKIVKKISTLRVPTLIWSTHGMTAPWAMKHKWWKKFLPWYLYQKRDLKRAQLIHCTSDFEVEWNKKLGFKNCFVAPLGTRLPARVEVGSRSRTAEGRILLFVGRIYSVKALDRLIEAFARVDESVRRNWTLRLVGPDQAGHMAELMALCDRLGLSYSTPTPHTYASNSTSTEVEFVGPKFAQDLDNEYTNCDCLALVSHTENFGATVVDAMAHGKPVITSTKTPWKVVADNRCGWWVDNDVDALTQALKEALSLHCTPTPTAYPSLARMGENGRALVEERYTWSAVCDKMICEYRGALG